ncbi:hypothetical protein Ssi02_58730 [Sinosporangium siamense]|uniref:Sigma-70 family RNA polymerase sigma factor n=1 Tax=Sinosporangium siamense TaxID=1367973 RepID=A0A919VAP5_9ACTN|nr:hypothetical protein Ssi02_58730 [Sinosporangium siamense]
MLYDCHAESIYRYCWSLLGHPDSAQVALRDTLIVAEARVHSLADPAKFVPWLYALARGESMRRRAAATAAAGVDQAPAAVVTGEEPADGESRVIAWDAVRGLAPEEREALELSARHGMSTAAVAAIVRVSFRSAEALLEGARDRLRDAVTAELLARKGPFDCPRRARILSGFAGELSRETRAQVIRHLERCDVCAPHRNRRVAPAKVFGLLPTVALPDTLRVRVMSCFVDPELVPYRRYVARRVGALDAEGFPLDVSSSDRGWPQAAAGMVAAVAAVMAVAFAFQQWGAGAEQAIMGIASGAFPASGEPPGIRVPWSQGPGDGSLLFEPLRSGGPVDPDEVTVSPVGAPAAGPAAAPSAVPQVPRPTIRQGPSRSPVRTRGPIPASTADAAVRPDIHFYPEERPLSRDHHTGPLQPKPLPGPGKPPVGPTREPPYTATAQPTSTDRPATPSPEETPNGSEKTLSSSPMGGSSSAAAELSPESPRSS